MDDVGLEIGGQILTGWESVTVTRSIDQITGAFELGLSDLPIEDDSLRRQIKLGEPCVVRIGDDSVISGYIEDLSVSYSGESHDVRAGGRDGTGDLVDCSADRNPGQWNGQTLEKITRDLVGPFEGVEFRPGADTGAPGPVFRLNPGETVFDAIMRGAAMRGVIPVSDGDGGLLFMRPGDVLAPVEINRGAYGPGSIIHGEIRWSDRARFSRYRVVMPGETGAPVESIATDPAVPRYRPLIVMRTMAGSGAGLRDRAKLEATTRAARSREVHYNVAGWRAASGWLWQPGFRIPVFDPLLSLGTASGAAVELLLASVTFTLDDNGGSIAALSLVVPEAFTIEQLGESDSLSGDD